MGAWISDISLFPVGRSIWVLFFALVAAWLRLLRHWVGVRQLAAMQQTDHRADTPVSTTGQPPRWAQRLWHNRLLWGCALFMLMLACCVLEWSRLYTINPASLPNGPGGVIGALAGPVAIRWLGFTGSAVTAIVLILACLSWVFRFSWLRVAELLGAQVDSWLMAARERRELAHDLAVGQEAARQREAVVQQELEQHQEKNAAPLVVEPPAKTAAAAPSARVVKERQHVLFQDPN